MAAWTSRAADSTSRSRSNCIVMFVEPSELDEVISVKPAMRPKRRSSGVATAEAMVAGLAPGSPADTEMVGKSTLGSGATGSCVNAAPPARRTAAARRSVATGRLMNGAAMFILAPLARSRRVSVGFGGGALFDVLVLIRRAGLLLLEPLRQPVHRQIDDRCRVQSEDLRQEQPADDGDAERPAEL